MIEERAIGCDRLAALDLERRLDADGASSVTLSDFSSSPCNPLRFPPLTALPSLHMMFPKQDVSQTRVASSETTGAAIDGLDEGLRWRETHEAEVDHLRTVISRPDDRLRDLAVAVRSRVRDRLGFKQHRSMAEVRDPQAVIGRSARYPRDVGAVATAVFIVWRVGEVPAAAYSAREAGMRAADIGIDDRDDYVFGFLGLIAPDLSSPKVWSHHCLGYSGSLGDSAASIGESIST